MPRRPPRGVGGLLALEDPFGNPLEIVWGHQSSETPFDSPQAMGAFSSEGGIGHVLYAVTSSAQALEFYRDLLGFAPTDYYPWGPKSAWFLRCSDRHHTVAFFDLDIPGGPGINHVMLEAASLADVGRALDRAEDAGVEIVNSSASTPTTRPSPSTCDRPDARTWSWASARCASTTPPTRSCRGPARATSGVTAASSWTTSRPSSADAGRRGGAPT